MKKMSQNSLYSGLLVLLMTSGFANASNQAPSQNIAGITFPAYTTRIEDLKTTQPATIKIAQNGGPTRLKIRNESGLPVRLYTQLAQLEEKDATTLDLNASQQTIIQIGDKTLHWNPTNPSDFDELRITNTQFKLSKHNGVSGITQKVKMRFS